MKKANLVIALLIISNQLLAQCNGEACGSLKFKNVQNNIYVDNLDGSRKIRIDYYYSNPGGGWNGLNGPHYKVIDPKKGVAIEKTATNITAKFEGSPSPPPRPSKPANRNEVIRTDMDLPIGTGSTARFKAQTSVTYFGNGNVVFQGTLSNDQDHYTGSGNQLQWRGNETVKFNIKGHIIEGVLNKDTTVPDQSGTMVLQKAGTRIYLDDNGRTK